MWRLSCAAVADGDAGRLLAAVLEGVEPDVGQAGDRRAGRPDADDAALLARAVRLVHGEHVTHDSAAGLRRQTPFPTPSPASTPAVLHPTPPGRFWHRSTPVPALGPGPSSPWPTRTMTSMLWPMLIIVRALGFLAPAAVALLLLVAVSVAAEVDIAHRDSLALVVAVAVVAGMTTMALLAWSYIGWRLNRIAPALERTLETDAPIHLHEGGIPGERRLARAFNAASGAFLQVEARATHDRLTGIPNRETLLAILGAEVERAGRHYKPLSVAFIDIDRFKPINDTYGHNSGDAVLRQVARLIADAVRVSDTFGRYGGEEFMLILPETIPEDAVELAEELRTLVQHRAAAIGERADRQGHDQHRHRRWPRL